MTLYELFVLLKRRLGLLVVVTLACGVLGAAYAGLIATTEYTATTSCYVVLGGGMGNATSTRFAEILVGSDVTSATAEELGLQSLSGYDVATEVDETTYSVTVSVTGEDPELVAQVATSLVANATTEATATLGLDYVTVIDEASVPTSPSSTSAKVYVAVGLVAGFFVAVVAIVLEDTFNTKVRSAEELEALTGVPVLAKVPYVKGGVR